MSTASAVLRLQFGNFFYKILGYLCLLLRRYWDTNRHRRCHYHNRYLCLLLRRYWDRSTDLRDIDNSVPMSTASAVLRHKNLLYQHRGENGTYVYCFGGIETTCPGSLLGFYLVPMSTASAVLRQISGKNQNTIFWYLCLLLRRYWDSCATGR